MNVLVDTSVWVAHFKLRDERLVTQLEAGLVICHPYIITEIACGTPPNRREVMDMLAALRSAAVATHGEVLTLIERRALHGRGCGLVDLSLLAAALMGDNTYLWTLDRRLDEIATEVGRAFKPTLQS